MSGWKRCRWPHAQIPYHAGMTYFELDRSNAYWQRLPRSAALVVGVEGDWPELEIECWALAGLSHGQG